MVDTPHRALQIKIKKVQASFRGLLEDLATSRNLSGLETQ